jgi:hypothetical protein
MKSSTSRVTFLTIIFFVLAGSVKAQVEFTKTVLDSDFLVNSQPFDLKVADLNNDNEIDIVVSSPDNLSGENSVFVWYQNDGNETFAKSVIDTVIVGGGTFDVGDIDSDLDNDIILAASGRISLYNNDGNGNFGKSTIDMLTLPKVPFIMDFDLDSDSDVVFAGHDGIFWENNDGNLNFTRDTVDVVTIFDLALFVADINDDSDNDVVAHIHVDSLDADMLVWYQNDGDENFSRIAVDTATQNIRSIVVDDLDDDSDKDIILVDLRDNGDFIQWYQNDGAENFIRITISEDFNRVPRSLAIADIDSDGDKDVLATGGNGAIGEVVYYENDGSESFIKRTIDHTSGNRQRLAVIDVDNDFDLDLFVINNFPFEVIYYRNDGMATGISDDLILSVPREYDLRQNYPNPFNPTTTIRYDLPEATDIQLCIYNLLGQEVRTLVKGIQPPGEHTAVWDGRNANGELVGSGTYMYRLATKKFNKSRNLLLLR